MKKLIFRKLILDIISFFMVISISITLIVWVIQAVNYLDFVSEDGHSFRVYFMYSLLSVPKIFSKLMIFLFFISIFYIIHKYKNNNELLVFWNHGIKKIQLINVLVRFSFIVLLVQLLFNILIVPKSQDMARSFIRGSNIDYFPALIKSKQFIDPVENLTIFIEKKTTSGELKNIFLKDNLGDNKAQIIFAESGIIENYEDNNYSLILYNGRIINLYEKSINNFKFKKTEFNLSNYTTKTTVHTKIQEHDTSLLIKCFNSYYNLGVGWMTEWFMCNDQSIDPVAKELFKRFITPFYILIVAFIAGCLTIRSDNEFYFNNYKYLIFILGIISIIVSEFSAQYFDYTNIINIFVTTFPFFISFFIYFLLIIKSKNETIKR